MFFPTYTSILLIMRSALSTLLVLLFCAASFAQETNEAKTERQKRELGGIMKQVFLVKIQARERGIREDDPEIKTKLKALGNEGKPLLVWLAQNDEAKQKAVLQEVTLKYAKDEMFAFVLDGKKEVTETFDVFPGRTKCVPYSLSGPVGSVDIEINVTIGAGVDVYVLDETNFVHYQKHEGFTAAVLKEGTVKSQSSSLLTPGDWIVIIRPAGEIPPDNLSDFIEIVGDTASLAGSLAGKLTGKGLRGILSGLKDEKRKPKEGPELAKPSARVELKVVWKYSIAKGN